MNWLPTTAFGTTVPLDRATLVDGIRKRTVDDPRTEVLAWQLVHMRLGGYVKEERFTLWPAYLVPCYPRVVLWGAFKTYGTGTRIEARIAPSHYGIGAVAVCLAFLGWWGACEMPDLLAQQQSAAALVGCGFGLVLAALTLGYIGLEWRGARRRFQRIVEEVVAEAQAETL
jgi:hypothetical protein